MHRVTVWRRKKRLEAGKPVLDTLGRNVKTPRKDSAKLLVVAHSINQYQTYREVDIKRLASQRLGKARQMEDLHLRRLRRARLPADLLLIALCDGYPTERVRRHKQIGDKGLAANVSRETGISKAEANRLIGENPEAEWLNPYRTFTPTKKTLIAPSRFKQCPSRIFPHLSRRMISYWRHHRDYARALRIMGR